MQTPFSLLSFKGDGTSVHMANMAHGIVAILELSPGWASLTTGKMPNL